MISFTMTRHIPIMGWQYCYLTYFPSTASPRFYRNVICLISLFYCYTEALNICFFAVLYFLYHRHRIYWLQHDHHGDSKLPVLYISWFSSTLHSTRGHHWHRRYSTHRIDGVSAGVDTWQGTLPCLLCHICLVGSVWRYLANPVQL